MRRCSILLLALLPAWALAAWDDEPVATLQLGYASRADWRGIQQAGQGAFGVARLTAPRWTGGLRWHEAWRTADPRVVDLQAKFFLWDEPGSWALGLSAAHRRSSAGANLPVRHATEVGVECRGVALRGFVPSVAYLRDLRRDGDGVEVRIAREFALTRWGAFLTWSTWAGWMDAARVQPDAPGPARSDAYAYYGTELRLPYRIGERTMLVLGAHATTTQGASGIWAASGQAGKGRVGLDLSVTFDF
ncbi:MAG: hypothetical protein NDI75_08960 [Candidatus Didemnitutus sp.]|nr:hypothetical protein [Candidatus Didemnitutus sp.]